ncbi:MAG: CobN/Magnesium Chelatase [Candidatus Argoarchaeum ethanivorans]|uniref:CobN/Magnesium Chelatase n=1 Tax=Candidatus Argoarchaeum ethanivorans TaxID=2608793 RepID=A0A811TBU1_9EURY|nr:MAG: CobN/Magnesium Chelatase [Candidatus Argoarchaeum ethanivorans]
MKITSVTWGSDISLLVDACNRLEIELSAWSTHDLEDGSKRESCTQSFTDADVVLLRPTEDAFWDSVIEELESVNVPIISFGHDPSYWQLSTVPLKVVVTVNAYHLYGGEENIVNMLRYIGKDVLGLDYEFDPPAETMWQGIYHPRAEQAFESVKEYLEWYKPEKRHAIGMLFHRTYWTNGDLEVIDAMIRELEAEFDVIPAFCYGMGDSETGAKSGGEIVEDFFMDPVKIDALVNLQSIFYTGDSEESVSALKKLNIPVFHPLTIYRDTEEAWMKGSQGMSSSEVAWSVAMPEFEGAIEPLIVGVPRTEEEHGTEFERHASIDERLKKIVRRIKKWIDLEDTPKPKRRVAFILHNSPCTSVEATVGAGAHLDTLESVARILRAMKEAGYAVDVPENGKSLIGNIMDHKAISEFRWTTIDEIVSKGGALAMVTKEEYIEWFDTLKADVRKRVCDAWGNPPGEAKDGVPAAMIYDGKIVVTGVRYGNAVVCVQPKRGCAGSRCDGTVCKILHDPEVPPPHQYMATYRWIEKSFGADVIIHVGTHGNIEFLPGKSVALSERCYPDIAIGDMPHLYIYNSDNPPEGTIAKRRSYATLIDHMQTVMTESGLYGDLKELEDQIAEYNKTKISDKARAHAIEHIIIDLLTNTNLTEELKLDKLLKAGAPFDKIVDKAHRAITKLYNTQIPDGMHIFGENPKGDQKIEFVNSIMRYDSEMRKLVLDLMGIGTEPADLKSGVLAEIDALGKEILNGFLSDKDPVSICKKVLEDRLKRLNESRIFSVRDKAAEIAWRIDSSDEIGSLLHGFDAGYIEPGPSGLITRGKPEVMPTGRNFYSLDPFKVPTKAAWLIGQRLADGVIGKYVDENGKLPENIAMYWMAGDIMWADGEQLAQIMHLIGVEPIWKGGKVKEYRILPLEELGRPRIDVTIRVSGITRDCFYNCIELVDDALREVAELDEPLEMNYIKKHVAEASSDGGNGDRGCARIFASKPGTYGNGVNLAVYASAWKEDKDISDVYIYWNGYEYGKGVFGEESHAKLISQLKSVDLTFNKTVTDEYDLLGCCYYFGTHGGLTTAAREISGRDVPAYYGDTRDRDQIGIRTLADEVRRVVRTKLLNPKWIEGMKRHGYKGAGDISSKIGRVYGWEATTQEVDDWIFDDITKTFILNDEMRKFFEENNPYALEEIGRRLLEAYERGLWDADSDVIDGLKNAYLEMEGWIEERMGDAKGDFQSGSIDVMTIADIPGWKEKVAKVIEG